MRYMGGKFKTAPWICPILIQLLQERKCRHFVDLFCGSVNITCGIPASAVPGRRIANDCHADLIAMWQAVQTGWQPPQIADRETHRQLMATRGQTPDPIRAFYGFGCSFRGKYFGGFDDRDAALTTSRAIEKKRPHLSGVEFTNSDYQAVRIPARSLVYCDIPYEGTQKFQHSFDHARFWEWAEKQSTRSVIVVSEYARNVTQRRVIATRDSMRFLSRVHTPTTEALVLV